RSGWRAIPPGPARPGATTAERSAAWPERRRAMLAASAAGTTPEDDERSALSVCPQSVERGTSNCGFPSHGSGPPRAALRASVRRHRRALRGCLCPNSGWIGFHAVTLCSILNYFHLQPVHAYGMGSPTRVEWHGARTIP